MDNYEQDLFAKRSIPMTVTDWLITVILTAIPLVGFILLLVWAFGGDDVNINKKNYAKATLILMLIWVVISILFFVVFGAAIFAAMSQSDLY